MGIQKPDMAPRRLWRVTCVLALTLVLNSVEANANNLGHDTNEGLNEIFDASLTATNDRSPTEKEAGAPTDPKTTDPGALMDNNGALALVAVAEETHTPTNAASCTSSEKLTGTKGSGYRGCQQKTRGGFTCQDWSLQSPHSHSYTPSAKPGKGLEGAYCRNPGGSGATIWCYTTSNSKRWEYCDPKPKRPTNAPTYKLVKSRTECAGKETSDYQVSVEACAAKCVSGFFAYGRKSGRCSGSKCKCLCEKVGTQCKQVSHAHYDLYRHAQATATTQAVAKKKD